MKKVIVIALLACTTVFFAGCGDNSQTVSESSGTVSIAAESSESESSTEESSETESSKEESSKAESSEEESSKEGSEQSSEQSTESSEESSAESSEESKEESQVSEKSAEESVVVSQQSEAPVQQSSDYDTYSEPEPSEEPSEVQQSSAVSVDGTFSENDMIFVVNNFNVNLLGKMSDVVSAIGQPSSTETAPSCLTVNAADDKMYYYNGYMIESFTDSEAEKVYMIQITGTGVTTAKGIGIGSTAEDIEKAYGTAQATERSDYYYSYSAGGKTHLDFILDNGVVTEIDYSYDVE